MGSSKASAIDKHYIGEAAKKGMEDGGQGSGNHHHAGRHGQRGGSAPKGTAVEQTYGQAPRRSAKAEQTNRNIKRSVEDYRGRAQKETASYPAGSKERGYAEKALKSLSSTAQRPTPEEAKALQEKRLGNISDQLKPYARQKFENAVKAEPQITSDLMDICDKTGAEMFGLPYRLKSAATDETGSCRIADKIAEDMEEAAAKGKPMTYEQAVDKLSDLVRYTQACTADSMAEQFEATRAELEAKGYKCVKVKNTWDTYSEDKPYRGLNTVFENPDGVRFELQFHTPESLFRKEFQNGLYEEQRDPRTPENRKAELGRQMHQYARGMQRPNGAERIRLATDARRDAEWRT